MRILVPIKRVIDYTVKIRVRGDKLGVDKKTAKMSMNPFCEIAIEEAVRMKERNVASEIIAVSIGGKKCSEQLRTAMAMGADRSIHVMNDLETDIELQPLAISSILECIVHRERPDLVLVGKQAIDDDCNQTAQMLAGRLNWAQAMFASKIEVQPLSNNIQCLHILREVDGGAQRISVLLPAVISADLRLNEPRFATLQNIMKARKKPIEEITIEDLGLSIEMDIQPKLLYLEVMEPAVREGGVMLDSVQELFDKLKEHQCF